MPVAQSWDGKWSGEGRKYVLVRPRGGSGLQCGRYEYRFDDGWVAAVSVREVNAAVGRKLRKQSEGFCGYDWMVRSLLEKGRIESGSPRV